MPPNYGPAIGDERFFEGQQVRCTDVQGGLPGRIYFQPVHPPEGWVGSADDFVTPVQWIELPRNAAEHSQRIESALSALADQLVSVVVALDAFDQRIRDLEKD